MVENMSSQPGESLLVIPGYSIIKELGRGGMGAVYLAKKVPSETLVALKVILPKVSASEHSREIFLREMENTRALKHENVVQMLDWGFSGRQVFFTLEYCDAGSVDGLMLRHGGRLSIHEAGGILLQALDGLEYAHNANIPYVKLRDGGWGRGRGLIHRDIKPSNIFLSKSENGITVKLGDYGLSKAFDTSGLSGVTQTGEAMGTPQFMPRQQVVNYKYAKPEIDVWAMAASLYNMITGYFPRTFQPGKDKWQTVLREKPVPVRNRDASIPLHLAGVIDLALADQVSLHFKSAASFKMALGEALK
jgi:serine/threonine protein kinase